MKQTERLRVDLAKQNIWFTADPHYFHENIIRFCERPFIDAEHMNEILVTHHNALVDDNDVVVIGGDLSFGGAKETVDLVRRLKGHKYLVLGNHDREGRIPYELLRYVGHALQVEVTDPEGILYQTAAMQNVQPIYCTHYACRCWDKKVVYNRRVNPEGMRYEIRNFHSWNLYGHTHGRLPEDPDSPLAVDIGVDAWEFYPASYGQLKVHFNERLEAYAQKHTLPFAQVADSVTD